MNLGPIQFVAVMEERTAVDAFYSLQNVVVIKLRWFIEENAKVRIVFLLAWTGRNDARTVIWH